MNFTMTKIAAAALLTFAVSSAYAADDAPDGGIGALVDLDVTSGTFFMETVTTAPVAFGAIGFDLVDAYGFQANLFPFFGGPVDVFTSDGVTMPNAFNTVSGGPVPNGTATASSITWDMSSFAASWNGTNFNQGANPVTGTYDPTTGAFTASWTSLIQGGPFNGKTGSWTVSGVAAAVPEASTYGMMLAGLGLVGGMVARRRKLMA